MRTPVPVVKTATKLQGVAFRRFLRCLNALVVSVRVRATSDRAVWTASLYYSVWLKFSEIISVW
jgi:hypothetical protein